MDRLLVNLPVSVAETEEVVGLIESDLSNLPNVCLILVGVVDRLLVNLPETLTDLG